MCIRGVVLKWGKIKDINDLVNATFQVKKFFRDTKKQYNLNYEEIYILNHILKVNLTKYLQKKLLHVQNLNRTI